MARIDQSNARTRIDIAESSDIARMARSDDPNIVSRDDVEALLGNSALVLDGLRRRPHYFDGRFLTGTDLKNLGWKPGKEIGAILTEAQNLQLEGKLRTHDEAVAWAS